MILLLKTAAKDCQVSIYDNGETIYSDSWLADRQLANGLLEYLANALSKNKLNFTDLSAIGVYKGPGSFTSLRIGITVANTLAGSLNIPIVGEAGDDWQQIALECLSSGQTDQIVLPIYGAEPNITTQRK